MGERVTLVRPDGSTFNAPREDVEQYRALGYEQETAEEMVSRNVEAAREEHFTSPGQRTIAGLEGFVNGLTVGGYTTLLGGGEDEQDRARYNPGTRLGGEIVGSVLPSLVPGGGIGTALRATPAGLLTRGAEAVAGATTATKTGHALVRGVVEGAGLGAGAAATTARLAGDPVTAEAVVAGMGWGALWGGGLGYVAGKIGVTADKMAAKKAADEVAAAAGGKFVPDEAWGAFRSAVDDVRKTATRTIDDAVARVSTANPDTIATRVLQHADELEKTRGVLFNRIDVQGGWPAKGASGLRKELLSTQRQITKAINDGDYAAFEKLSTRHTNAMKALGDLTKQAAPEIEPFVLKSAAEGASALDGLKSMSAVAKALDGAPFTSEGLARMTPKKMEKFAAAAEAFIKNAPEELAAQKEAMSRAIDDLIAAAGLQVDNLSPAQKLRHMHEALRSSRTRGAAEEAVKAKAGGFGHSTAKYVGGKTASNAASQQGFGIVGRGLAYEAGSRLVGGLLALKNGVLSTVIGHAQKWMPAAAKVTKFVGPKVDPLKVRLDGSLEESDKPRKQLMESRMKEIRDAAPTINDTIYRAVEPIAGSHTALAVQMNKAAVAQFQALASRLPRDPGMAFNRMKSLWTPDGIMIEQFARAYEVFQNPVGVTVRWLQNPRSITPEGAAALKEMNPELWQTLRVEMLSRLAQPGVLDRMKYHEQVGLGQLLDLRIHSTQDPRFIQAQQEMFQMRKEPLPARPSAANNSNNPSGTSKGMTAAQRITEH
jgi:hypothetical protein